MPKRIITFDSFGLDREKMAALTAQVLLRAKKHLPTTHSERYDVFAEIDDGNVGDVRLLKWISDTERLPGSVIRHGEIATNSSGSKLYFGTFQPRGARAKLKRQSRRLPTR